MMITDGNSLSVSQSQFVESLFGGNDEFTKVAAEGFSAFIQSKIREGGFARKLIKPTHVTQADLHMAAGSEQGHYMLFKDVDSRAMVVSTIGRGEHRYYHTDSELISFQNIASEKLSKSKWEMMTGGVNYQDIFKKRISEEMFQVEDRIILDMARDILATEATDYGTVTTSGNREYTKQNVTFTGAETMDKNNLVFFNQMSTRNRIRPSKYLLTETLLQELMLLTQQDVGDTVVSELFKKGAKPSIQGFLDVEWVTTIKDDLVANNEILMFPDEEFYGKFLILQDHQVYLETKRDIVTIDSVARIAHGVGNTNGITKATFEGIEA